LFGTAAPFTRSRQDLLMSKPLSAARLHLCQERAFIPGGTAEERERDYAETLHKTGPVLIQAELDRIKPDRAPDNLVSRIFQALDILLGRRHVFVERRHPRA
jgi:hypothetical protein